MQLVAYNPQKNVILAEQAVKGTNYQCIECGGVVRRRGGMHRRDHFFHVHPSADCRSSGKSMVHLQVQMAIQQQIPRGEAVLEKKFDEIQRIADVCWIQENLVFEVQCSPISPQEILERNRDYRSVGYEVVWILHDARFNKRKISAAEHVLESSVHYYTNIDIDGVGWVYDQLSKASKGTRVKKGEPVGVFLSQPRLQFPIPCDYQLLKKRIHYWSYYFSGDIVDKMEKGETGNWLLAVEEEVDKVRWVGAFIWFWGYFLSAYKQLFRFVLDKVCK